MGHDTPVAPWRIGLSVVVPCYIDRGDHRSIHELLRTYNGYGADLLDRVEFILVDDGSPVQVELPAGIALNLRLLRLEDRVRPEPAWTPPRAPLWKALWWLRHLLPGRG